MPTGIAFKYPECTYGRIAPRSGLTIKNNLTNLVSVINPDYMGEIIIVLYNFGTKIQTITQGQRIAQVIFEKIIHPTVQIVNQLPTTLRLTNGFGSTDKHPTTPIPTSSHPSPPSSPNIPTDDESTDKHQLPISTINILQCDLNVSREMPYNIYLSLDPFDNYTHRTIQVKGTHPSLGLNLQICKTRHIPQIINCIKSTPIIRIPRWCTEIKHGYIIAINNTPVSTIDDIHQQIQHI